MACAQGQKMRSNISISRIVLGKETRSLLYARKDSRIAMLKVMVERAKDGLATSKMDYIDHIADCDECAARNDAPPVPQIYAAS